MQLQIAPQLIVGLEQRGLGVESYDSLTIPSRLIDKIADFYRYIFNNNGNYLVFPTTLEFMSPAEVFEKSEGEMIKLETMDSLTEFPVHPQTGEQAIFWHDPDTTLAKIRTKLNQDSHVTILRDLETGSIEGLSFGHKTTVRQQFEYEGWRNPLYYSGKEMPEHNLKFPNFLNKLREKMHQNIDFFTRSSISGDSAVYSWNCIITSPKARGIKNLLAITSQFFASIPKSMKNLPVISETRFQSTSHGLFTITGYLDVPGILSEKQVLQKNADSLIIIAPLSVVARNFSLPPREFRQLARNRKRNQLNNYKA